MFSHSLAEIGTELGMRYSKSSSSILIASAVDELCQPLQWTTT